MKPVAIAVGRSSGMAPIVGATRRARLRKIEIGPQDADQIKTNRKETKR